MRCVKSYRGHGLLLFVALALSIVTARALETVMQDDFTQANGTPLNPAQWTVSASGVFTVASNALQGSLASSGSATYAEVANFTGKDVVVEFDLQRFSSVSDYFDLVLRQNANGNTRIRFGASSGAGNRISAVIMQPGSETNPIGLGQSAIVAINERVSLRVRVNDARVQLFSKTPAAAEYVLQGEYSPIPATYISAGEGTVRLLLTPPASGTKMFNLDHFKVRRADSGKKVYADFHTYRYTREHDGQLGNWKQEAQSPVAPYHIANYNADLMDENGVHQLAAPGTPPIGMQSYNDPDYAEYHVLTAKMAGIDGFFYEYGCSAGLTDADLQLLQATAQSYGMEFGINWLDAFYYAFVQNTTGYQAWCTANGRDPSLDATKFDYIPQVFQQLIDWVYDKPNAAKIGGKPLMLLFQGSPLTAANLATLKTKTYSYGGATNVPSPFLMPRRAPMGLAGTDPNVQKFWSDPTGWETHADGTFGWKPLTERAITSSIYKSQGDERDAKEFARAHVEGLLKTINDRINMAGVMPGFDNKYNASWGQFAVELLDRKNGITYTEVWEQYLRDRDVIDAVLIPSWSDHTEGSGIEPLSSYGDRELRATAKYSAQFKGQPNTSATLDFTLPAELFKLRKLSKFLQSAGCPAALLDPQNALLNAAGQDISSASYPDATAKLASARATLDALRNDNIRTTVHTSQYFTEGAVTVANNSDQYINIPDATADLVRGKYFDGKITFEYLDNSTYAANKTLFLIAYPSPAGTGKPGEWRDLQMQMRHGNGDGQWKTARVALNKKNLRLDHHVTPGALPIDLYFSSHGGASNGGTIRNATVTLTTHEYFDAKTSSTADGNWSQPSSWSNGVPSDGGAAGIVHNITFQAGDSWTGGAWPNGLLIGYDSWGENWGLDGAGSGILNVTGGNLTTGHLGLGAGNNGGYQTGTLNISGGNVVADKEMLVGWSTAGGSSVNISGGAFTLAANPGTASIGHGAAAAFTMTGGIATIHRTLAVQNDSTLQIGGTGLFRIANGGILTVPSGALTVAAGGVLEVATGGSLAASGTLTGGTLKFAGGTGSSGINFLVQSGGVVDVNGQTLPAGTWANYLPYGDGNNRLINSSSSPASIADGNTLWLWSSPTMTTTIDTIGDLTIHSWITGSFGHQGGITKTGPGLLAVTNPGNDYTGHTIINGGMLRMSNARLADGADVRIGSGATLDLTYAGTDAIRSLYIQGSKKAAGTWGAFGSGAQHETESITGPGMLQLNDGARFSDWASENGIPGEAPDADYDNDGIKNLIEYALGMTPVKPDASPGTLDENSISFTKGAAAVENGDVAYTIQTSTTLAPGSWGAVTPTFESPSMIYYTFPSGLPRLFARLAITQIR